MTETFRGAKVAIVSRGRVVTLLRDERADIPWPGMWDLPGGGREGDETPEACMRRETREEVGIDVPPAALRHRARHVSDGAAVWFFVAEIDLEAGDLRLGDEGQAVRLMAVAEFMGRADVIPTFQARLGAWLDRLGGDLRNV